MLFVERSRSAEKLKVRGHEVTGSKAERAAAQQLPDLTRLSLVCYTMLH